MRGACDRGQVMHAAAAVVHMGEHQQRHLGVQRGDHFTRLDQRQREAALARQAVGDVQVGREVAALRNDDLALRRIGARQRERRAQHLVQIDRRRIAHHDLARPGAHQLRDLVADASTQRHPAGAVPASDQVAPPFVAQDLLHASRGGLWQHAERIAVEVDHPGRQIELFAQRRQCIFGIECQAVMSIGHHSSLSTARTGEASAVISFRGRAISS